MIDIALVWAGLIAFSVLAYVLLDGFDLGVGILFGAFDRKEDRDLMMNTVAPVWDGNETWLVLGGGGLFAVFPLAYATIMPALYAPIIIMLLGLVFRGVAFEYRWRTERAKWFWDFAFCGGSAVAAFAQGVSLGALVQGIKVVDRSYVGGWFDWLTPFSVLTGVALLVGYTLLGATWLVMKTEGPVRLRCLQYARHTGWLTLALIAMVSLITPQLIPEYADRWFVFPTAWFSLLVPVLVALSGWQLMIGLQRNHDRRPFFAAIALFVLCYMGILISFYPFMVPPTLSIWDVAAPRDSQLFLLVGAVVLIPMVLAYTAYSYWVFRGKVDPESGYH